MSILEVLFSDREDLRFVPSTGQRGVDGHNPIDDHASTVRPHHHNLQAISSSFCAGVFPDTMKRARKVAPCTRRCLASDSSYLLVLVLLLLPPDQKHPCWASPRNVADAFARLPPSSTLVSPPLSGRISTHLGSESVWPPWRPPPSSFLPYRAGHKTTPSPYTPQNASPVHGNVASDHTQSPHQLSYEDSTSDLSSSLSFEAASSLASALPPLSERGIYQIQSKEQYDALIQGHPDKLIVIKFYASYCRACRQLEQKLRAVQEDPQLDGLPVVWGEYESLPNNRQIFRDLSVVTLPTIHFYDGQAAAESSRLVDNFPCPPAKIPMLKKKLSRFLNNRVDPVTLQLKALESTAMAVETEPKASLPGATRSVRDSEFITPDQLRYLRHDLPFFQDLTNDEFEQLLDKAKLLTFNPGDIIIRQGMPGTTFFVLKRGLAEMVIRSRFDDPISTPPNYLGVVVNELKQFDYFGERALTTGEPYAASVRVLDKVRCFAFDVDDIPESSILNKKRRATQEMVEQLSHRYQLPSNYQPTYLPQTPRDACVLELLIRFKLIRQAAKCLDYAVKSAPQWGDEGEIARRTMLWSKLSKAQRDEFEEVFDIIDVHKKGKISLLEMRRFMESAREPKSDDDLRRMIAAAAPGNHQSADFAISRDEFVGVMAEAEFYSLFTETFRELDPESTGYVRAGDLDEVLGGVRNLVSNDRVSLIDVEDKDMLVDYEQFSKMLLGAAL